MSPIVPRPYYSRQAFLSLPNADRLSVRISIYPLVTSMYCTSRPCKIKLLFFQAALSATTYESLYGTHFTYRRLKDALGLDKTGGHPEVASILEKVPLTRLLAYCEIDKRMWFAYEVNYLAISMR